MTASIFNPSSTPHFFGLLPRADGAVDVAAAKPLGRHCTHESAAHALLIKARDEGVDLLAAMYSEDGKSRRRAFVFEAAADGGLPPAAAPVDAIPFRMAPPASTEPLEMGAPVRLHRLRLLPNMKRPSRQSPKCSGLAAIPAKFDM